MRFAPFFTLIALLTLAGCAHSTSHSSTLKPFTTDGCSLWAEGTTAKPNLWHSCCVAHDRDYWIGGSAEQRKISDEKLRTCVNDVAGKTMADEMYSGVRWGGAPYWLTTYRWGYGWNYFDGVKLRGNKIPDAQEQQQIDALLQEAEKIIAEDAAQHFPLTSQKIPAYDKAKKTDEALKQSTKPKP